MIFLTSWDDVHHYDLRVAEMLEYYNLKGTFFVPIKNIEGHDVISEHNLLEIDKIFEIGAHTLDHVYLTKISANELQYQINIGKEKLEEKLGHLVTGFCYPGGKWNKDVLSAVIESGFKYARTTENLSISIPTNPLLIPTTLQFYDHKKFVFFKNILRHWRYNKFSFLSPILSSNKFENLAVVLLEQCMKKNGVFHIWGHSWEINEYQLWDRLDYFLSLVADFKPSTLTLNEYVEINKLHEL